MLYAYFVYQGRRQLSGQLRIASTELSQAESQRDECLAAVAAAIKDTLAREGIMNTLLEAVDAATAEYGQSAQQKQSVEVSLESEVRGLDDALAQQQAKLSELQHRLQQCERGDADAQLNLRREQARLQRLGIERRNIEQALGQDPTAAAKLEALRQQEEGLTPQVDAARAAAAASGAALDGVNVEAEQINSQTRELQRRKDLLLRSQSIQLRQASVAADTAVARKNKALADLGRAILAANGRIAVDETALKELTRHDEAVNALWLRQQVYLQALDGYDRDAVRRATTIAVVCFALLVLAIVWRVMT